MTDDELLHELNVSQNSSDDEEADVWVQCDECNKWRRLPFAVGSVIPSTQSWHCSLNPNAQFASCQVPQELSDDEIDNGCEDDDDDVDILRSSVPPVWQWTNENCYISRKQKQQDDDDVMICQCKPRHDNCGSNCLNRVLCIECSAEYCPCGTNCQNQMFTRKQFTKVEVKRAGKKGFGLFAVDDVQAGQLLLEYHGEVLDEQEYGRRKEFYREAGFRHFYFMHIGEGEVIDACRKGNHGRFFNHSCEPNCKTQKWLVHGELVIGFFAIKAVPAGGELTFNYNFKRYGDAPMRCHCGSANCRKYVGGSAEGGGEYEAAIEPDQDLNPIMVTAEEVDEGLAALLEWRVRPVSPEKEALAMYSLMQLCKARGSTWIPSEAVIKASERYIASQNAGTPRTLTGQAPEIKIETEELSTDVNDLDVKIKSLDVKVKTEAANSGEKEAFAGDAYEQSVVKLEAKEPSGSITVANKSENDEADNRGTGTGFRRLKRMLHHSRHTRLRQSRSAVKAAGSAGVAAGHIGNSKQKNSESTSSTSVATQVLGVAATAQRSPERVHDSSTRTNNGSLQQTVVHPSTTSSRELGPKASEVQAQLSRLIGTNHRFLKATRENVQQVVRLFDICEMKTKEMAENGTNGVSPVAPPHAISRHTRSVDLTMLLEVLINGTTSVREWFVDHGIVPRLHTSLANCLIKPHTGMLRKMLVAIDALPFLPTHMYSTNADGKSLSDLLHGLTSHSDLDLRLRAMGLLRRYPFTVSVRKECEQACMPRSPHSGRSPSQGARDPEDGKRSGESVQSVEQRVRSVSPAVSRELPYGMACTESIAEATELSCTETKGLVRKTPDGQGHSEANEVEHATNWGENEAWHKRQLGNGYKGGDDNKLECKSTMAHGKHARLETNPITRPFKRSKLDMKGSSPNIPTATPLPSPQSSPETLDMEVRGSGTLGASSSAHPKQTEWDIKHSPENISPAIALNKPSISASTQVTLSPKVTPYGIGVTGPTDCTLNPTSQPSKWGVNGSAKIISLAAPSVSPQILPDAQGGEARGSCPHFSTLHHSLGQYHAPSQEKLAAGSMVNIPYTNSFAFSQGNNVDPQVSIPETGFSNLKIFHRKGGSGAAGFSGARHVQSRFCMGGPIFVPEANTLGSGIDWEISNGEQWPGYGPLAETPSFEFRHCFGGKNLDPKASTLASHSYCEQDFSREVGQGPCDIAATSHAEHQVNNLESELSLNQGSWKIDCKGTNSLPRHHCMKSNPLYDYSTPARSGSTPQTSAQQPTSRETVDPSREQRCGSHFTCNTSYSKADSQQGLGTREVGRADVGPQEREQAQQIPAECSQLPKGSTKPSGACKGSEAEVAEPSVIDPDRTNPAKPGSPEKGTTRPRAPCEDVEADFVEPDHGRLESDSVKPGEPEARVHSATDPAYSYSRERGGLERVTMRSSTTYEGTKAEVIGPVQRYAVSRGWLNRGSRKPGKSELNEPSATDPTYSYPVDRGSLGTRTMRLSRPYRDWEVEVVDPALSYPVGNRWLRKGGIKPGAPRFSESFASDPAYSYPTGRGGLEGDFMRPSAPCDEMEMAVFGSGYRPPVGCERAEQDSMMSSEDMHVERAPYVPTCQLYVEEQISSMVVASRQLPYSRHGQPSAEHPAWHSPQAQLLEQQQWLDGQRVPSEESSLSKHPYSDQVYSGSHAPHHSFNWCHSAHQGAWPEFEDAKSSPPNSLNVGTLPQSGVWLGSKHGRPAPRTSVNHGLLQHNSSFPSAQDQGRHPNHSFHHGPSSQSRVRARLEKLKRRGEVGQYTAPACSEPPPVQFPAYNDCDTWDMPPKNCPLETTHQDSRNGLHPLFEDTPVLGFYRGGSSSLEVFGTAGWGLGCMPGSTSTDGHLQGSSVTQFQSQHWHTHSHQQQLEQLDQGTGSRRSDLVLDTHGNGHLRQSSCRLDHSTDHRQMQHRQSQGQFAPSYPQDLRHDAIQDHNECIHTDGHFNQHNHYDQQQQQQQQQQSFRDPTGHTEQSTYSGTALPHVHYLQMHTSRHIQQQHHHQHQSYYGNHSGTSELNRSGSYSADLHRDPLARSCDLASEEPPCPLVFPPYSECQGTTPPGPHVPSYWGHQGSWRGSAPSEAPYIPPSSPAPPLPPLPPGDPEPPSGASQLPANAGFSPVQNEAPQPGAEDGSSEPNGAIDWKAHVRKSVKFRLGKYEQSCHPMCIPHELAMKLCSQITREVVMKEEMRGKRGGQARPLDLERIDNSIKDLVRTVVRRTKDHHAPSTHHN